MVETLQFESQISDIKKLNPMFSTCRVRVMYAGENRNGSIIPKEVVDKNIDSIYNIPIIGEFIKEKKDFGSHGGKIQIKDGDVEFIKTTTPFGVVPSTAKVYWDKVQEKDGLTRDYLTVDGAILWTGRFSEAERVIEKGNNQSMEINVANGEFNKDKKYEINDFNFSGLCILGEDVEPAFESASITGYALNEEDFKEKFNQMLEELKFAGDYMANKNNDKKKINIDNSKDAANMTGAWSDVDKTALRHKLTEASNAQSLVDEGYLIVDHNWKHAPSDTLHYPHHEVKGDTLVVHKKGLFAAHARLMQEDPHNEHAIKHLKRHYRELGLDMSDFEQGGDNMNQEEYEKLVTEKANLERDLEAEKEKSQKFEADLEEIQNKVAEMEQKLGEAKVDFEKLEQEKKDLEEYKLNVEKEAKEKAVKEMFEKVKGVLNEDELKSYKEKASEMEAEDLEREIFAHIGRKEFNARQDQNRQANFSMGIHEPRRNEVKGDKGYEHIIEEYKNNK